MSNIHNVYRAVTVVPYECIGSTRQKTCCLGQLQWVDKDFESRLKAHGCLQHVFDKMTAQPGQDTSRVEDFYSDEVIKLSTEFLEFGLMNRARFACEQKKELARSQEWITEATKSEVISLVNEELEYASMLLERFNSPKASELKMTVQAFLHGRLDEYVGSDISDNEEDESVGADDSLREENEDAMAVEGAHVIPDDSITRY